MGALRSFFPRLITDRGADYFRRGAVEVLEWTEQGIHAHVQGRTLYTTGLACRPREARSVDGPPVVSLWCDCPFLDAYDTPCKHLWAVIQEADALGALGALFATGSRQVRSVQLGGHPRPIRDEEPAASTVTTRASSPRDDIAGRAREASPASLRTGEPEANGHANEVSAGPPLTFEHGSAAWRLRLVGEAEGGDLHVRGVLVRSRGGKEDVRPLAEAVFALHSGIVAWPDGLGKLEVDDELTWQWLQSLCVESPVVIPAEDVESFLDEHLVPRDDLELRLPAALELAQETVAPRPALLLRVGPGEEITGRVELEYGDRQVSLPHRAPVVVDLAARRVYPHDPTVEVEIAEKLLAARFWGLVSKNPTGTFEGYRSFTGDVRIASQHLPKAAAELLAAGWRVLANGKPFRPATAFAARVRSGQNWFEVEGSLEFDGERLGLPELLRAARRGQRLVELGDGSLGLLPEAWLTRLGMLGADEVEAGKVRVPRSQLLFLDELASAEAGVSVDAAFRRLRGELRGFRELSPADPPSAFQGELRDYQRQGLAWMQLLGRLGFGGCLADDMGLGKTVQVLALLLGRKRRRRSPPSLVVAPSSVVFNWAEEARRFAPSLRVAVHSGPARQPLEETLQGADVIVTSYALLRREAQAFTAAEFDYVILDEAQAIKNYETETAKVARALRASARLTMTGTPIENHLGEIASQLEFLNPGILGSSPRLAKALLSGRADAESLQVVQPAVKPFLLRRTKREVARELPERVEQDVFVELGKRERRRYDELLQHYRKRIEDQVAKVGLTRSTPQVLEALLRLRQAACHPGLIDPARRGEPSAKLERVIEEIERIGELGERCLVFSQFTSLLAILRDRLDARGVHYEYLDGSTRHRQAVVERFQSPEGAPVFLISLLAGGVGLNLTAAEHVLLLDPWWNPAVEAQAIDRSHRIGQTRTVFAYKLIARGTVEEKVIALQKEKRALAEAILGDGAGLGGKLTREDLEVLLR